MNVDLKIKCQTFPVHCGVYIFRDDHHVIIYVGKANNLRKRIAWYFLPKSPTNHNYHYQQMQLRLFECEFIITKNKYDALVLEYTLIKKHAPLYNSLFKDNKRYPYILVTRERYPRILIVRTYKRSRGFYYGPLPDGIHAREICNLLNRLFPFRKCTRLPTKSCIYYDLKQCAAPCINIGLELFYQRKLVELKAFLSGNQTKIIRRMIAKRDFHVEQFNYEQAQKYHRLIENIHIYHDNNQISTNDDQQIRHVVGIFVNHDFISVSLLILSFGKLINHVNNIYFADDNLVNVVNKFLFNYYGSNQYPDVINFDNKQINIARITAVKQALLEAKTNKKILKLIALAVLNATHAYNHIATQSLLKQTDNCKCWTQLEKLIGITNLSTIEIIDCSHSATENYVGCVQHYSRAVLRPLKCRRYRLSVTCRDDLTAIAEVIKKRYSHLSESQLPNLIIADGGIHQVRAIISSFHKLTQFTHHLAVIPTIVGLVKDKKHQTSYLFYNDHHYNLKIHPQLYLLLRQYQENIHNYTIRYHRQLQTKSLFELSLSLVKGVGPVIIEKLCLHYGTLDKLHETSLAELITVTNNHSASEAIFNKYHH